MDGNHGTLPITDIVLTRLTVKTDGPEPNWVLQMDSGSVTAADLPCALWRVVAPGDERTSGHLFERLEDKPSKRIEPPRVFAEVTFVDAEGLRWSRTTENREPQRVIEK